MTSALPEQLRFRIRQVESSHAKRGFPVFAHAAMLADQVRMAAFRKAIDEVVHEAMEVVEIGAGTGVLAWHAARKTGVRVFAIEVDASAVRAARIMLDGSPSARVELHQGLSLGRPIEARPDVLIAEVLGPLGLEEGIVEICHEFVTQYPSVRQLIPSEVSLWALPVRSEELRLHCAAVAAAFHGASTEGFDYHLLDDFIEDEIGRAPFQHRVGDALRLSEPIRLARFELGKDRSAAFAAPLRLGVDVEYVNLFFEARLSNSASLSTACDAARTHWPCHFVRRPSWATEARVSYDPLRTRFDVTWSAERRGDDETRIP